MASGIFAILDDIAALMDDVAVTSKVAANKTAAILGDDLAVNAEKATGFVSSRELPVLWEITKGSFVNKLIIVPIALALNVFFPVIIKYILILGGFYLAYEGVEKLIEYIFHRQHKSAEGTENTLSNDPVAEKKKVRAAIITDFILSIEIVIIALNTVLDQSLLLQALTVSIVAILATVGVYGIVALIVRMDDAGFSLIRKSKGKGFLTSLGKLLVKCLPVVIKVLGYIGTAALFMVAGGIFEHNIEYLHHFLPSLPSLAKQIIYALVAGVVVILITKIFSFSKRVIFKLQK